MRKPHRVKQIIAITLGIVLLVATIVALNRDYTASSNTSVTDNKNNTVQTEKADNQPDTRANNGTITPPAEKADEKTLPTITEKNNSVVVENKNDASVSVPSDAPKDDKKESTVTENNSNNSTVPENKESDKTVVVTDNFVFTANPGDYYTAFARDAIRQYAVKNKIDVTEERLQQAAAILADQAGSPYLEVGQIVTINNKDVSTVLGVATDTTTPKKDTSSATQSKTTYTYTAVDGDSYALLARRAIDEYAKSTNTALNPEQRIAAETYIISDAGFPAIDTNQQVSFAYDTVKGAVTKATSLSPAQLQNWQPYAALAGF